MFERVENADGPTDPAVGGGCRLVLWQRNKNRKSVRFIGCAGSEGGSGASQGQNKPRTPEQFFVFEVRMRASEAESSTMLGARDFADAVIKTNQLQAEGKLCGNLQGIELIGPLLI